MGSYEELNINQTISETDDFTPYRYRQFTNYISKDVKIILDVGCNTGRGGMVIKNAFNNAQIMGLDCVKGRLDRLPKDVYNESFCAYSDDIPIEDNNIDIILAGEFIEHLDPLDVNKTFEEFYRILKVGGRLLLTTPNPNYLKLRIKGGSVIGGAHLSEHTAKNLAKVLSHIGFEKIIIKGSGRVSRILGQNFPLLSAYGSYLAIADKV